MSAGIEVVGANGLGVGTPQPTPDAFGAGGGPICPAADADSVAADPGAGPTLRAACPGSPGVSGVVPPGVATSTPAVDGTPTLAGAVNPPGGGKGGKVGGGGTAWLAVF